MHKVQTVEINADIYKKKVHLIVITCSSAEQSVGSLWQHGNFNTSQLQHLSSYNNDTLHV